MAQQQFCLKWNNYQTNMSDVFQNMLLNENMVDVTLACEGASLKAHKMVLAACSPFFHSLFMSNPCKHPIVILKDVRFVDLKSIIDFMYRGEVNVSQDQLAALLKAAETLRVKGLAEVTEKQARGQPQLQQALFGKSKKRKRNRNRGGIVLPKGTESGISSESEDEIRVKSSDVKPSPHRLGGLQRTLQMNKDHQQQQQLLQERKQLQEFKLHQEFKHKLPLSLPSSETIEPSRLLEQSMSTGEIDSASNGQDNVIVASDVQALADDEAIKSVSLFDAGIAINQGSDPPLIPLPGPSVTTPQTPQARRLMMSEAQKTVLKEFLNRPISYFDVVIDDWKKSIVWQYFGELAFKDPETGTVSVIDNERHYCLKCIVESQERNPEECFEKCNICYLSNGTATGNHKNHLRLRHQIIDEQQKFVPRSHQRVKKRNSRVMTISLDELVPVDE